MPKLWILLFLVLGLRAEDVSTKEPIPEALMPSAQIGHCHYTVTTDKPMAQAYFNQGLAFVYDYSYRSAKRSFEEALKADPECAMAHWGIALANGNTINSTNIDETSTDSALQALEKAQQARHVSPLEQELIAAQKARFAVPAPTNRESLNLEYANAMRQA